MPEITCVSCGHGPHTNRECMMCSCKQFANSELVIAQTLISINNLAVEEVPKLVVLFSDLVEIFAEVYPDAVKKIDERRAEFRAKLEEEKKNAEENVQQWNADVLSTTAD